MQPERKIFVPQTLSVKLSAGAGLLALADFFFYGHPLGWAAGIYAALLLIMTCVVHRKTLQYRANQVVTSLLCTIALELLESPSPVSLGLYLIGLVTLQIRNKRRKMTDFPLWIGDMLWFAARVFRQGDHDRRSLRQLRVAGKIGPIRPGASASYILMPALLLAAFISLFMLANPVIADFLGRIDWRLLRGWLSPWRLLFWTIGGAFLWSLLRPRFGLAKPVAVSAGPNLDRWFNTRSIILSLALFNILFAVENALDIAFLWRGETLPAGLTYAEYARAGAYPLIFTALLAGGYVLVTFHDKKYQTRTACRLVGLWTLQNIFLVVSAIYRTLNYIEIYSLTYMRLAALIWMGLVAAGLALIALRIFLARGNLWLVNMNALALMATLYACCFINFNRVIADYNARHAAEVTGTGQLLDFGYMRQLGPDALPALRWFGQHAQYSPIRAAEAENAAAQLATGLRTAMEKDWRFWTWRRWRNLQDIPPVTAPEEPRGRSGWYGQP